MSDIKYLYLIFFTCSISLNLSFSFKLLITSVSIVTTFAAGYQLFRHNNVEQHKHFFVKSIYFFNHSRFLVDSYNYNHSQLLSEDKMGIR